MSATTKDGLLLLAFIRKMGDLSDAWESESKAMAHGSLQDRLFGEQLARCALRLRAEVGKTARHAAKSNVPATAHQTPTPDEVKRVCTHPETRVRLSGDDHGGQMRVECKLCGTHIFTTPEPEPVTS